MRDSVQTRQDIKDRSGKNIILHAVLMHHKLGNITWEEAMMWAVIEMDDMLNSLMDEVEKLRNEGGMTWNMTVTPDEMDRLKAEIDSARDAAQDDN